MTNDRNNLEPIEPSAARRRATVHPAMKIDLKDPDFHTREDKHEVFRNLRRTTPVYWNPEIDSSGFWAITRYKDVLRVVQDSETFSADVANGGMRIFNIQDVTAAPCPHLLSMDPPQHTQLRKALQPLFSPAHLAHHQRRILTRAKLIIDAIAAKATAETVGDIAVPFTLGLLIDLLAVPESDSVHLLRWSNAFLADDDPDYLESVTARQQMVRELDSYALKLYEARNDAETTDFASLLLGAKIDGHTMGFDTFSTNFGAFIIAVNETTRHTICSAIYAMTEFPEEKAKLLADRSLIPLAAKEFIRWATPLMHVRRTAMRDTTIAGQSIRKGDKVVAWYSSANRDETIWPDAAKLDVCRYGRSDSATHLAFGAGPHHCLGWRFAELQVSAILDQLLQRLPDIRTTGAPRMLRSNFISGIKELRVVFTPETF